MESRLDESMEEIESDVIEIIPMDEYDSQKVGTCKHMRVAVGNVKVNKTNNVLSILISCLCIVALHIYCLHSNSTVN